MNNEYLPICMFRHHLCITEFPWISLDVDNTTNRGCPAEIGTAGMYVNGNATPSHPACRFVVGWCSKQWSRACEARVERQYPGV